MTDKTHWVDCWRHPDHHECALAEVEKLLDERDEIKTRLDAYERSESDYQGGLSARQWCAVANEQRMRAREAKERMKDYSSMMSANQREHDNMLEKLCRLFCDVVGARGASWSRSND